MNRKPPREVNVQSIVPIASTTSSEASRPAPVMYSSAGNVNTVDPRLTRPSVTRSSPGRPAIASSEDPRIRYPVPDEIRFRLGHRRRVERSHHHSRHPPPPPNITGFAAGNSSTRLNLAHRMLTMLLVFA